MTLGAQFVYPVWIGHQVTIPFMLTFLMGAYTIIWLWSVCFSTFLFGIGKLRLQLVNIAIVALLFIPMAVVLTKLWGIYGIVIALALSNLSGAILNPIQFRKILSGRATGIWNA
jgi:O-antigen/teichoic acid export membrane protein